jgi:hypothetical protein
MDTNNQVLTSKWWKRIVKLNRKSFLLYFHLSVSLVLSFIPFIPVSGVPRNFIRGGSTNSVEDRENGDLGALAPCVRGSGGSCNLVQQISFHIVKFP